MARFAPAAGASPRGAVVLAHAMMADKRYQRGLAAAFAAGGVLAYTFDFRGHGESDRPRGWSFADLVERDLPAVVDAVTRDARCAAGELGFVGHSLGGLAGVAAFGAGVVAAPRRMALVSATPWTRRGPLRVVRRGVSELLAAAARPTGLLPARRLRLGSEDESARYLADFAGWVRAGAWPYLDGAAALRAPTLVVFGARDVMCRRPDAAIIADRLAGTVIWMRAPGGHFGLYRARALWPRVVGFIAP